MVHLQENDYNIEKIDTPNEALTELKVSLGVPPELASCHTAEVGGYIIEGHVPAEVMEALLLDKPDIVGLALPGMPTGAPGMGSQSDEPLEILAFDRQGKVWIYTTW